jgi:hypothetical protein
MSRRGIAFGDAVEEVIKRVQTAKMLAITLGAGAAMMAAGLLSGCTNGASSSLQPAYSPSAQPLFSQASAAPAAAASRSPRQQPASAAPRQPVSSAVPAAGVPGDVPMPNRALTPGAIQSSDTAAICTPGWAEAHRDVSDATKDYVASEYGLSSRYGYEIDHLIPLELGGSNSVPNLWPEPYGSPYGATQKDGLEDYLHEQVCYHGLPLATAQHEIAVNWYAAWVSAGRPTPQNFGYGSGTGANAAPSQAGQPAQPAAAAWCSASASYNSSYGDYDVYVHSNQPDQAVTASSGEYSKTWHTDSSGYADVYLRGPSPGNQISVRAGAASCFTTAGR